MKRFLIFILGSIFLSANVQAGDAQTTLLSLLRATGARPAAMGEAFVGAPADIQHIGLNPANLASLSNNALTATYLNGFADDKFGNVSYAHNLSFGNIFIGGSYYDGGDVELNTGGNQQTVKAQSDSIGLLGLALGRTSPLSFGATAKFYKSELAETASASGVAADTGLFWRTPVKGLGLGASAQNLGSDLQYEVEKEPLPQTIRVGAAFDMDMHRMKIFKHIPYRALVAVDAVTVKNQDSSLNSGFDVRRDMEVMDRRGYAALRGGYKSELQEITAGVGFQISNVVIDYAIIFPKEELDNTHRVTLSWLFLPPEEKVGKKHLQ